MVVHAGSINRDHVHMLLSIPPSLSVSRAVQQLKGRSSHKLLSEFAMLRTGVSIHGRGATGW
jgi:putative transposase